VLPPTFFRPYYLKEDKPALLFVFRWHPCAILLTHYCIVPSSPDDAMGYPKGTFPPISLPPFFSCAHVFVPIYPPTSLAESPCHFMLPILSSHFPGSCPRSTTLEHRSSPLPQCAHRALPLILDYLATKSFSPHLWITVSQPTVADPCGALTPQTCSARLWCVFSFHPIDLQLPLRLLDNHQMIHLARLS